MVVIASVADRRLYKHMLSKKHFFSLLLRLEHFLTALNVSNTFLVSNVDMWTLWLMESVPFRHQTFVSLFPWNSYILLSFYWKHIDFLLIPHRNPSSPGKMSPPPTKKNNPRNFISTLYHANLRLVPI